jgi:hypothetical protein
MSSECYVFPPGKAVECQAMLDAINNHPALPMPCASNPDAQSTTLWQQNYITLTDGRHIIKRIDETRLNMIMPEQADRQGFLDVYLTPHGGTIEVIDYSLFPKPDEDLIEGEI